MNKLKSIKRILLSEFVTKFTFLAFVYLIIFNIVFLLNLFLKPKHLFIFSLRYTLPIIATMFAYQILLFAYREKALLDKNRIAYLNFSKHEVGFAKLISEILFFMFSIVIGLILIIIFTFVSEINIWNKELIIQIISWFFSFSFYFAFIIIGFKLVITIFDSQFLKKIFCFLWGFVLLFLPLIIGFILKYYFDWRIFVSNNKLLFSILPILNFFIPFFIIMDIVDWYYIFPFLAWMIFFISILWFPIVKKLKTHYCI